MRKFIGLLMMVLVFAGWAGSANASLLTFAFTGIVTGVRDEPGNIAGAALNVNDSISGFFSYNTNAIDRSPTDPEVGEYGFIAAEAKLTFIFGSSTLNQGSTTELKFNVRDRICGDAIDSSCSPSGTFDQQLFMLANGDLTTLFGWTPDIMVFGLSNFSQRVLASDALPESFILDQWEQRYIYIGGGDTVITGSILSIDQVPNPATLALFSIGLAGLGWSRRKKA